MAFHLNEMMLWVPRTLLCRGRSSCCISYCFQQLRNCRGTTSSTDLLAGACCSFCSLPPCQGDSPAVLAAGEPSGGSCRPSDPSGGSCRPGSLGEPCPAIPRARGESVALGAAALEALAALCGTRGTPGGRCRHTAAAAAPGISSPLAEGWEKSLIFHLPRKAPLLWRSRSTARRRIIIPGSTLVRHFSKQFNITATQTEQILEGEFKSLKISVK